MKKLIYTTITVFVAILIVTYIIARQHPLQMVKFENNKIVEVKD